MIKFNLVENESGSSITAFYDGEMYTADNTHPNWDNIKVGVIEQDLAVLELFSLEKTARANFEKLSSRVTVQGGSVFFDGDRVHNSLVDQIARFVNEGVDNWEPLVKFYEKVMTNPNEHSREQLYNWLVHNSFSITPEGNFVAYKGVAATTVDGVTKYLSVNSGRAIVDGVEHDGQIPNDIGSEVTMPRSKVAHDPGVGCSQGLHAGTYEYARDWASGALLEVEIDPRDVVSVPTDCDAQKVRVCRYLVKNITETKRDSALYSEADTDGYEYPEEYDDMGY